MAIVPLTLFGVNSLNGSGTGDVVDIVFLFTHLRKI